MSEIENKDREKENVKNGKKESGGKKRNPREMGRNCDIEKHFLEIMRLITKEKEKYSTR